MLAFGLLAALGACVHAPPADTPVGVQLYTVRADMDADPLATLDRVAALGFGTVEFYRTYGDSSARMCERTRDLGLGVAATHVGWEMLRDDPARAIAEAKAMCTDTVMLAWLPPEERETLAQWREWIARMNAVAAMAAAEDMRFAYHAHDIEFRPVDGTRPIDLLMDGLDPRIGFELDTYWVARGGEDPLAFYTAHRDRIRHFHLKDMAANGAMADVGDGTLDFAALFRAADPGTHWLVERDDAPDPWASLADSFVATRAIAGAAR